MMSCIQVHFGLTERNKHCDLVGGGKHKQGDVLKRRRLNTHALDGGTSKSQRQEQDRGIAGVGRIPGQLNGVGLQTWLIAVWRPKHLCLPVRAKAAESDVSHFFSGHHFTQSVSGGSRD